MKSWIKIFSTRSFAEASIVKGMLEENNIQTILFNRQDSNYLLGEIELYVSAHFKDIATHLIDKALFN